MSDRLQRSNIFWIMLIGYMRASDKKWGINVRVVSDRLASHPQLALIVIREQGRGSGLGALGSATWGTMPPVQPPGSPGIQLFQ